MNVELLSKIVGLLGFIISVLTFILTRYERRKRIEIEVFDSVVSDFAEIEPWPEELNYEPVMKIRFTNLGSRPIIVKPKTLSIGYQRKVYSLYRENEDYLGMDSFEELLSPMSVQEIGVFQSSVLSKLEIEPPKQYDDESFNRLYPLVLKVEDHNGKVYVNKSHSYHEAVGQYVT